MKVRRAFCAWLALVSIVFALAPPFRAQDTTTGESKLVGKVFAEDGKTPIAGAIVLAYHLSTESLFSSEPTGPNAEYEIADNADVSGPAVPERRVS